MDYMIGFVVLHYGDVGITDACIQSILRLDGGDSVLIVIVDNDVRETRTTHKTLKSRYEQYNNIVVLTNAGLGGFSEANNIGYAYARDHGCQFVVISNNDVIFPQTGFLKLLRHVYDEKRCHVLAPDVIKAGNGQHQNPLDTRIRTEKEATHTIRMNRMTLAIFSVSIPMLRRWERQKEKEDRERSIATGTACRENIVPFGACLIFTPAFVEVQRKAFEPETMFFYEEYILALRCQKLGYLIRYVPNLRVIHESGAATDDQYHTDAARMKFRLQRTRDAAEIYLKYLRSGR